MKKCDLTREELISSVKEKVNKEFMDFKNQTIMERSLSSFWNNAGVIYEYTADHKNRSHSRCCSCTSENSIRHITCGHCSAYRAGCQDIQSSAGCCGYIAHFEIPRCRFEKIAVHADIRRYNEKRIP